MSEPKYLRRGPVGYDFGEDNQFRTVRSRALRLAEVDSPPQSLTAEQISSVMAALPRARDKLLAAILAESGMRIGEALGLRREDMHLLASNNVLGCAVPGPHVHVRRRANANGSLAKSRFPRSIPVTASVVDLYADYQFERSEIPEGESSDFVFVNLYKPPLGEQGFAASHGRRGIAALGVVMEFQPARKAALADPGVMLLAQRRERFGDPVHVV